MNRTLTEQYVMGSIALLSSGLARYGDGLLEGLTFRQWFMLRMIARMPTGEKSLGDIAEYAGTTRQNVRKMLETLESRGYVRIERSEHDGRALAVGLTDQARHAFESSDTPVARGLDRLFSDFSDEELFGLAASLNRLLETLGNEGDPSDDDSAGPAEPADPTLGKGNPR